MANTQGIKAGRAYIELGVGDKLTSGLKRAQARLKAFGSGMTTWGTRILAAGAALATPAIIAAKSFASMGDAVAKMSRRTGVGVEALSELGYAAELSGTDMESLENGLRRMQRTVYDAGRDLSTAKDALADLGLSAKDFEGLSPEDQFTLLSEAVSRVADPSRKAAVAMAVLGRSGTMMLPMMEKGAAGLDEMRKKARDLGLSISTKDAAAAERLTDAFTAVWRVIKQVGFAIGAALAPQLSDISEKAAAWTSAAIAWINQNRGLIVSIAKLAVGVVAAGAALVVAGKAVSLFGNLLGAAATVIPLLLSPIGMVITAVGALGAYMLTSTAAGGKALDWLGGKFSVLQDDAAEAYGGITDALAAGDIGLAAKVLWSTLKLWWTRGVSWLGQIWNDAMLWLKDTFTQAWGGVRSIFAWVTHGLEIAWIETTSFLADTWSGFVNGVLTAWHWVGKQLTHAWNWIKSLFDDSFDADAANQAADQAYAATKANLDKEMSDRKKAIEDQRASERGAEQKDFEDKLRNIATETADRRNALQKEHDAKIKAAEAGVDAAKKEFDQVRKTARDARKAKEAKDSGPGSLQGPDVLLKRIGDAAAGLGDQIKTTVTGTFNASALFGMGASSAADRTAKATEQTAKNTKKLLDTVDLAGSAFV